MNVYTEYVISFRTIDQFFDGNKFPFGIKYHIHPWSLIGLDIELAPGKCATSHQDAHQSPSIFSVTSVQHLSKLPPRCPVCSLILNAGSHSPRRRRRRALPDPPCCESASRPQMTMRSLVHIPVRRSQMRERTEVFEYEFFAHRVLCHGTKFDSTRERSRSSWLSFPLGTEISPQHQSQRSHLTT